MNTIYEIVERKKVPTTAAKNTVKTYLIIEKKYIDYEPDNNNIFINVIIRWNFYNKKCQMI